jgi:ABC-2 type transport system permease protein
LIHRALLKKSLQESKWILLGSGLWLLFFCWVRVWIVSRLEQNRFEAILQQFADIVSTFSPVSLAHLTSFTGRIAIGFDDALITLVVIAFAISRGSDVISGELQRGTLEMLLAQPLSRLQILCSHSFITILGIAVLATCTWVGTYCGIHTTRAKVNVSTDIKMPLGVNIPNPFAKTKTAKVSMATQVNAHVFWPASFNLFCLGCAFAGVTTMLSAWESYRWRTVGYVSAFLVLQIVIKLLGVAVKDYRFLKNFSLITAYEPQIFVELMENHPHDFWHWQVTNFRGDIVWGPLPFYLVLLTVSAVCYVAALCIFSKRDLPTPI